MGTEKMDSMYPILKHSNTNVSNINNTSTIISKSIERDFSPKTALVNCNYLLDIEQYKTRFSGTPIFQPSHLYGENCPWSSSGNLNEKVKFQAE
jgi:hypothetical protein